MVKSVLGRGAQSLSCIAWWQYCSQTRGEIEVQKLLLLWAVPWAHCASAQGSSMVLILVFSTNILCQACPCADGHSHPMGRSAVVVLRTYRNEAISTLQIVMTFGFPLYSSTSNPRLPLLQVRKSSYEPGKRHRRGTEDFGRTLLEQRGNINICSFLL